MLENFEPKTVFKFFEEMSNIPRGSKNEQKISDYFVKFAKDRNLEVIQDEELNILIKKPATKGYENRKKIILQGHMDMVCEKDPDKEIDFLTDSITLKVEEDFIKADKTTLGADNGIGAAMALAILDNNSLKHGPLSVVLTVSEETDMHGAQTISKDFLKGDYLFNIDSEEEGILTVSSAGGELYSATFTPENSEIPENAKAYKVSFSGYKGGHSGGEIAKNRGNMIKVMNDYLLNLKNPMLIDFNSGSKDNAIPSSGTLEFAVEDDSNFEEIILKLNEKYKEVDGELKISGEIIEAPTTAASVNSTAVLCDYIKNLHTGVKAFTDESRKFVELSSNLATINKSDDKYHITDSMRFGVRDNFNDFKNDFIKLSDEYKEVEYVFENAYPEWEYRKDSPLREKACALYKDMYKKEMEIDLTHGGLECGVFYIKNPNLDFISFGPDIFDPHTPRERVSISSTKRVYDYLIKLLEII